VIRIADLDYIWTRLTAGLAVDAARIWLQSANQYLGGSQPLEWLRVHGPARVIEAFDAAEAGSYA